MDMKPPPFQQHVKPERSRELAEWLGRHWLLIFSLAYGLFVVLPWLAPVFMHLGWSGPGRAIYFLYTFFCHQLPQRSFFLFGEKTMYSLIEIQTAWQDSLNPLVLRQFIGNPEMGWKVAWSDRMVSMYTSVLVFTWLWRPFRKRIWPLPWWGWVLFLLPMFMDGSTHALSDLAGIGQGFRDSNAWLAALSGNVLPHEFYAGDALGSFNSWMRLLTGILFGLGLVWFAFPFIENLSVQTAQAETLRQEMRARLEEWRTP